MANSMIALRPRPPSAGFSPRTPGPLGHNDGADPDAPCLFPGDTPGSLGLHDWADPDLTAPLRKPPVGMDSISRNNLQAKCIGEAYRLSLLLDAYSPEKVGSLGALSRGMIRMALAGAPDEDVMKEVKKAVAGSESHKRLAGNLSSHIGRLAGKQGAIPGGSGLLESLQSFVGEYPGTGALSFRGEDPPLKAAIGDMNRLEVERCSVANGRYEIRMLLGGSYDFGRGLESGGGAGRSFGKRLLQLLNGGEIESFWSEYEDGLARVMEGVRPGFPSCRSGARLAKTFLAPMEIRGESRDDMKSLWESFIYAIREAGFTKPLAWKVEALFSDEIRPSR